MFRPSLAGIIGTSIITSIILFYIFAHITKVLTVDGPKKERPLKAKISIIYFVLWPILLFVGKIVWDLDIFATENLWRVSLIDIIAPYLITRILYYMGAFSKIAW